MDFIEFMRRSFSKTYREAKKEDEYLEKRARERGDRLETIVASSFFRKKYLETVDLINNTKMTELEKNRFLKRAIFFREVSRGNILLNSKEEEEFFKEDKRLAELIKKQNNKEAINE